MLEPGLHAQGKTAQAAEAMREAKLQIMIMGISELGGSGKFILRTGETIVYSGRDDEGSLTNTAWPSC